MGGGSAMPTDDANNMVCQYTVTLEDAYGTAFEQKVRASSAAKAFDKAVRNAPGQEEPTVKYADDADGVRHHAE